MLLGHTIHRNADFLLSDSCCFADLLPILRMTPWRELFLDKGEDALIILDFNQTSLGAYRQSILVVYVGPPRRELILW